MKYTPGPWKITARPKGWLFVGNNKRQKIAVIEVNDEGNNTCDANARLIAAVPELLEALENILNVYVYTGSIDEETLEQAEDAIAKAKGE